MIISVVGSTGLAAEPIAVEFRVYQMEESKIWPTLVSCRSAADQASVHARVESLEKTGDAKRTHAFQVVALSGREAELHTGKTTRYPTHWDVSGEEIVPTEYRDSNTGVYAKVIPSLRQDGRVGLAFPNGFVLSESDQQEFSTQVVGNRVFGRICG